MRLQNQRGYQESSEKGLSADATAYAPSNAGQDTMSCSEVSKGEKAVKIHEFTTEPASSSGLSPSSSMGSEKSTLNPNAKPRYVVNQVIAGDYDYPIKVLKFLTDLHASFCLLNLRNDFLWKKFDGTKYNLRRVEEDYFDVKIRGWHLTVTQNETKPYK